MGLLKVSAFRPQQGARPLGKIEVLPNAIHSIAVQAISECYGVVGVAAPRLHNGQAVLLSPGQGNQGVQVRVVNDQIIIEVYVALEYGLRMSEIAHNTIYFKATMMYVEYKASARAALRETHIIAMHWFAFANFTTT